MSSLKRDDGNDVHELREWRYVNSLTSDANIEPDAFTTIKKVEKKNLYEFQATLNQNRGFRKRLPHFKPEFASFIELVKSSHYGSI